MKEIKVGFVIFLFWIVSIWLNTVVFTQFQWFIPNFYFLFATIFILCWKGEGTSYIAMLFGLTQDCFSSLPFGLFAIIFLVISLPLRWYAIKVFQESILALFVVASVGFLLCYSLVALALIVIFNDKSGESGLGNPIIFYEAIATTLFAPAFYYLLKKLDKELKIRFSERKF